jgi:hypothetical protein
MIGQGFVQVVAEIPPDTEPVGDQAHEVAFRAHAFKEHHQLQFEEDHRVDAWAAVGGIVILHQVADKREVEHLIQVAIEMVRGY